MTSDISRTAEIRALARSDRPKALQLLQALLAELFDLQAEHLEINDDPYSLNSLNGFFSAKGSQYFFKFHQEEGEEAMSGEYYRADILAKAGFPVDQPVHISTSAGEQILIYRRRSDPRFSEVLRSLDFVDDKTRLQVALDAERNLAETVLDIYLQSLHPITPDQSAKEPIHRLFYERLTDSVSKQFPGGRFADFYVGKSFQLAGGIELDWADFSRRQFVINGTPYATSVGDLFDAASRRLRPDCLADAGGIVAHGDAHNANVWYTERDGQAKLSFFDPAFAGTHVPSLMAEIKPTFHNIFAHPLWLYEPALASRSFTAQAKLDKGRIVVETNWRLSLVRQELLAIKAERLWRPLLKTLQQRQLLPADWRQVIRLGLFLSPTLVMNLRAGARSHDPISSLIAFCVAVMVGSPPTMGTDIVTEFLDKIDPSRAPA